MNNKPKTDLLKERCDTVTKFFQEQNYVTKKDIATLLNWEYPKRERSVRDIIANIAKELPIIATSDATGYKLAKTPEDKELVKHTLHELGKRVSELNMRLTPLESFLLS
jgi:hypothetical protein